MNKSGIELPFGTVSLWLPQIGLHCHMDVPERQNDLWEPRYTFTGGWSIKTLRNAREMTNLMYRWCFKNEHTFTREGLSVDALIMQEVMRL